MSIEQVGNNIVDLAAARQQRDQSKEKKAEEKDFLLALEKYKAKFEGLNKSFQDILDDPKIAGEDRVVVRRQIEGNKNEIVRILFTMSRYRSYDEQLQKIERLLRIFHSIGGETRERVNRSLDNLLLQLEDFRKVFINYGISEEAEKVAVLKERISRGLLENDKRIDNVSDRGLQSAEQKDAFATDVELFESLLSKMKPEGEYDLGLVEEAKRVIEDFSEYVDAFRAFGALDKLEQYRKMHDTLTEALAQYERRDTSNE